MADLSPGRTFRDLELPDHNGVLRTVSELAEGDPVVLNFFRGRRTFQGCPHGC